MATIVTRAGKGAPLLNTEVDANFTNLDTDKLEAGDALGTPASVTLTNATGLPTAGLVDNAVTDPKLRDSAGLSVMGRGANSTGDPADIVAGTNKQVLRREGSALAFGAVDLSSNQAVTGTLPVNQGGTGITSFGTGVAAFLGTPSSANLAAALTDETGTGAAVFATNATLVNPALGTPASGVATNLTGTAAGLTAGNVTTNANLTGAITSTGNATLLGSFSSANLAAAVTDETGTGALVFATSPTLVTPALGTPASGVATNLTGLPLSTGVTGTLPVANGGTGLTSYTANGVIFASGTTTLASGNNLTFNGAGNLTLKSPSPTGSVLIDGTGASGGGFTDYRQNGLRGGIVGCSGAVLGDTSKDLALFPDFAGAGIRFYANGSPSEVMRLTSTGLGIGTTSPSQKLHVVGKVLATDNLEFSTADTAIVFQSGAGRFFTGGSERLRIDASGNLGLGVVPSAFVAGRRALQMGGTVTYFMGSAANVFGSNHFFNGSANLYIENGAALAYAQSGGEHIWITAPSGTAGNAITFTQAMTLDASGNLGIGTSAPSTRFHMSAGDGAAILQINQTVNANRMQIENNSSAYNYYHEGDVPVRFFVNATERLRITGAGNVGIATTSPDAKLTVNGAASFAAGTAAAPAIARSGDLNTGIFFPAADTIAFAEGGGERVRINSLGGFKQSLDGTYLDASASFSEFNVNTANFYALIVSSTNASPESTYVQDLRFKNASPNNVDARFLACTDSTEEKAAIRSNGDFTSRTNSYGGYSDLKLKENVVDASEKLTDIMQLQVRNFNFKNDPDLKQIGFIAQEFEQIFPALVTESQDRDQQGNISNETTKSIKTSVLIPILVKAMQEQQAIIQTLEQRISALENA